MNKSKKTPLLLVIALIICMGLTAGLTMAFFGGTSTGSSTVTLKTGVKVGATATASNDGAMVVPGQPIDISATGTVEPYSSTGTVVPALLRLKFTIGGAMDVTPTLNTTDAMTIKTEAGDATGYWVLHTDGYYYLCAEAAEATVANTQLLKFTPVNTTTEEDKTKVSLTGNFVVPTSLGNEYSGKALNIKARFEVIQAEIYANGSDTAITDENLTIGNEAVQEVFGEFAPPIEPIASHISESSAVLSSAQFENGEATLTVSELAYDAGEGEDYNAYLIPITFENVQNEYILNISFTVDTGGIYAFGTTVGISTEEKALFTADASQETNECYFEGDYLNVNAKLIVAPNVNTSFTIIMVGICKEIESFDINFTLTEMDSIDYNQLLQAGDNGIDLNLTPNNVTSDGMAIYNLSVKNMPSDTDDIVYFANANINGIVIGSGTLVGFIWATPLMNEVEGSATNVPPSYISADTGNILTVIAMSYEEALTEESVLNINATIIKIEDITTPIQMNSNGEYTVDFDYTLSNTYDEYGEVNGTYYWQTFMIKGFTGSKILEVVTSDVDAADIFFVDSGDFSANITTKALSGTSFEKIMVEEGFFFTVNSEQALDQLTFKLYDPQAYELDLAEITATSEATEYNVSISGTVPVITTVEIYNFTITNITENCKLQVTLPPREGDESYSDYNGYRYPYCYWTMSINEGHNWKLIDYSGLVSEEYICTFDLTAGSTFDFNVVFEGDSEFRYYGYGNYCPLTFKIVTE